MSIEKVQSEINKINITDSGQKFKEYHFETNIEQLS